MIHRVGETSDNRPIYGLTIRAIGLLGFVTGAVAVGLLLGVLALSRANESAGTAETGITRAAHVGRQNCEGVKGLAKIQRALVQRQEAQTKLILSKGVTFGIPPSQLPGLLARSRASQAQFLAELDRLADHSCASE